MKPLNFRLTPVAEAVWMYLYFLKSGMSMSRYFTELDLFRKNEAL